VTDEGRPTPSTEPVGTATLIACDVMTPVPNRGSILPAFTPAYACELENVARRVDFCMIHAGPELSYPCSQTESVQEHAMGQGSQTLLLRLDSQPFPQARVVGAGLLGWSEDGEWLDVSLWDGSEDGFHRYRLRTDGSGQFERLP